MSLKPDSVLPHRFSARIQNRNCIYEYLQSITEYYLRLHHGALQQKSHVMLYSVEVYKYSARHIDLNTCLCSRKDLAYENLI